MASKIERLLLQRKEIFFGKRINVLTKSQEWTKYLFSDGKIFRKTFYKHKMLTLRRRRSRRQRRRCDASLTPFRRFRSSFVGCDVSASRRTSSQTFRPLRASVDLPLRAGVHPRVPLLRAPES